jgi:pimeloyl-ACP methyl ester carboxylesterase
MECRVEAVALHYVEHGAGTPLVVLHGAGVDHREVEAAFEAVRPDVELRRVYPDLPGMGRSTADGLGCNDDAVRVISEFVERVAGGPVLLAGHSYGAYLARGVAARRPELVLGLALLCPVGDGSDELPPQRVVQQDPDAYDELEPGQRDGFDEYFVVRTRATARRYREHVVPGTTLVDERALERIFSGWAVDVGTEALDVPTLLVAGRCDSYAGYVGAMKLLERYPRATLTVLDDAGHALLHERPELLRTLLEDWVQRALAGGAAANARGLDAASP